MDRFPIELAQICQAYFILAAAAAVGVNAIPPLRQPFVLYGARSVKNIQGEAPPQQHGSRKRGNEEAKSTIDALLEQAAKLQVPHSWFIHFYIVSVASSVFWAWQIITRGVVFTFLVTHFTWDTSISMTLNQVVIAWLFLFLHGVRRLYESITFSKPSSATMPIIAYAVAGIAFYVLMGMSIWAEGIPALLDPDFTLKSVGAGLLNPDNSLENVHLSKPSIKTFIAVPLFLVASGIQHDCHEYLSGLKKYTLPESPIFKWVLCPHYTAECVIYFALAIVAAPEDRWLNRTVLMALLFSAANLAVTADSTKTLYAQKFGSDKVKSRWKMVPFLY